MSNAEFIQTSKDALTKHEPTMENKAEENKNNIKTEDLERKMPRLYADPRQFPFKQLWKKKELTAGGFSRRRLLMIKKYRPEDFER